MREFKFIRGKYTDENIFNSDETGACLFAYDKEGTLVSFKEKNNEDFQNKFAGLSSDDRLSEIYTLRPSQFTISAKQKSDDSYDFTFTADEKVYDGSRQFPTNVIQKAEELIKANTTGEFNTESKLPILNLDGAAEQKTPTAFTFNNKTFKRNLVFKVSGLLKERGYITASGENITAYPKSDDKIDFGGTDGTNAKDGTFCKGILQKIATTKTGTIYRNTATISAIGELTLAKNYVAGDGFTFIKDDQFETDIPYQDDLSFKLYSKVSSYLTEATASDAVTSTESFTNDRDKYKINTSGEYEFYSVANANDDDTYYTIEKGSSDSEIKLIKVPNSNKYSVVSNDGNYEFDSIYTPVVAETTTSYTINSGYVAYDETKTLSELIDESKSKVYERDETNEVTDITSLDYNFYYVNTGTAYMLKGDCSVPNGLRQSNQFVEGYAASYNSYYVFKNEKFSNISATDLLGNTAITYYESKNHNIVGTGVYDNDDADTNDYVMFSDEWRQTAINSSNTSVRNSDNIISPIITNSVLRLLTDDIEINATQSD